jgi:uncharacterized coiled-coil protein SlyX
MKHRYLSLLCFLVLLCALQGYAQENKSLDQALNGGSTLPAGKTTMEARMEKMENLLTQQKQEIDTLRKQLVSEGEGRMDKARADEIKKLIKEVLADEEFRNSIYQPTLQAGYDKGFYIKSADDAFYMKIRARTQFRYVGVNRQSRDMNFFGERNIDDTNGFTWTRLRLLFTGWLWNKDLEYNLTVDGSTNYDDANVKMYEASFTYQYAKGHKIQWGKFLLPFGKQAVHASTYQQMLIEQSITTATFNPGQSLGIMAKGDLLNKKLSYAAGVFNGTNNSQDDVSKLDSKFSTAGRAVYHILNGYDELDETDFAYHDKPALDIGASYLYNQSDNDVSGQPLVYSVQDLIRGGRGGYATSASRGSEVLQFGADVGFKYKGFSASGEYFIRNVDSDHQWSAWNRLTGYGEGTGTPQGGYVQAGYFIVPKKFEVAGRLGGVWGLGDDQCWEQAIGFNYYIKGHALKLSGDVTHIAECPISSRTLGVTQNDDIWMYRLQIQATMD